ncbi:hypothetical protein [Marinobacter sp.]|uniref:hypothetical protein n=1 Tax=Marinobacter sp. TaxID=50741 RepID=UPI00384D486C
MMANDFSPARACSGSPESASLVPRLFFWSLFCLPVTFALPATADIWSFTGTAVSLDGEELYQERHTVEGECRDGRWHSESQEVLYLRPGEDEHFARKTLDYRESALRPSFVLEQPEWDERMEVTNHDDEYLTIDWQTNEGGRENYRVPLEGKVVVDSGFDTLVRYEWASMKNEEPVDFQFLAPTRGEHYPFVLETGGDNRVAGDQVLRIRPTGLIMGFLVDPLHLAYNDRGMLKEYFGLTNIRRDADNNYKARIEYSHGQTPECSLIP